MLTEWCGLKRCPVPTASRISSIVNPSPMLLNTSADVKGSHFDCAIAINTAAQMMLVLSINVMSRHPVGVLVSFP